MNFVAWAIVASEIGFWVVILLGLFARYVLKRQKLGLILLALTPVIDLILLITTSIDLYGGATATTAHAVAAVYIGVSIAFGKDMIAWADERFRYYVAKQGSKPLKRYGLEYAKHYLKSWIRHVLAYLIGAGLLFGLIYLIDDASRTEALSGVLRLWTAILGIDLIITISNFIWPKKEKVSESQ
ncbi:hypothetical protein [Paenibacillus dendritiformis]|uniref:Permease n=1 Tax=Paenibacillus dendritiformis C454 TaxID=1131935 RepID=H3SGY4_9BACL|nr:hypothetical protein [Paenibacillus dendritiformis]EHQ61691.1 permease [Paenibacillus dendritiformis C454]CAH8771099.1 hypothetical protein H7S4_003834 [Paenibacillus dendritiformis]